MITLEGQAGIQSKPEARLIIAYGIAYFDLYLKGAAQPLLTAGNIQLAAFEHQP